MAITDVRQILTKAQFRAPSDQASPWYYLSGPFGYQNVWGGGANSICQQDSTGAWVIIAKPRENADESVPFSLATAYDLEAIEEGQLPWQVFTITPTATPISPPQLSWRVGGGKVHCVIAYKATVGMDTVLRYDHRILDIATRSWDAAASNIFSLTLQTGYTVQDECHLAWRSDGTLIAMLQDADFRTMGSNYNRVSYATWTSGGGWSSLTAVDSGGELNWRVAGVAVHPTSSRTALWIHQAATDVRVRMLSSAGSLGTLTTVDASGTSLPTRTGFVYDYAGTGYFACDGVQERWKRASDAQAPATTVLTGAPDGANTTYGFDPVAEDVWRFWPNGTVVSSSSSTNGGSTWSGAATALSQNLTPIVVLPYDGFPGAVAINGRQLIPVILTTDNSGENGADLYIGHEVVATGQTTDWLFADMPAVVAQDGTVTGHPATDIETRQILTDAQYNTTPQGHVFIYTGSDHYFIEEDAGTTRVTKIAGADPMTGTITNDIATWARSFIGAVYDAGTDEIIIVGYPGSNGGYVRRFDCSTDTWAAAESNLSLAWLPRAVAWRDSDSTLIVAGYSITGAQAYNTHLCRWTVAGGKAGDVTVQTGTDGVTDWGHRANCFQGSGRTIIVWSSAGTSVEIVAYDSANNVGTVASVSQDGGGGGLFGYGPVRMWDDNGTERMAIITDDGTNLEVLEINDAQTIGTTVQAAAATFADFNHGDIAQSPNGDLWVFTGAGVGLSSAGHPTYMYSDDYGATWSGGAAANLPVLFPQDLPYNSLFRISCLSGPNNANYVHDREELRWITGIYHDDSNNLRVFQFPVATGTATGATTVSASAQIVHAPAVTASVSGGNQTASVGSQRLVTHAPSVTTSPGAVSRAVSAAAIVLSSIGFAASPGAASRTAGPEPVVAHAPAVAATPGAAVRTAGPAPAIAHAPDVTVQFAQTATVGATPAVIRTPDVTVQVAQAVAVGAGPAVLRAPDVTVLYNQIVNTEVGPQLIGDSGFDNPSYWDTTTDVTVTGGAAVFGSAGTSTVFHTLPSSVGASVKRKFRWAVNVTDIVSGPNNNPEPVIFGFYMGSPAAATGWFTGESFGYQTGYSGDQIGLSSFNFEGSVGDYLLWSLNPPKASVVVHAPAVTVSLATSVTVGVDPVIAHAPDVTVSTSITVELANQGDIAVNGGFDADTDWTKGAGWSIAGGVASHVGPTGSLLTNTGGPTAVIGRSYRLTFTISNYSGGQIQFRIGSDDSPAAQSANGTFTEIVTATVAGQFTFACTGTFVGDIDNAIVEPFYDGTAPVIVHAPDVTVDASQTTTVGVAPVVAHAPAVTVTTSASTTVGVAPAVAHAPDTQTQTGAVARPAGPAPAVVHAPAVTTATGAVSRSAGPAPAVAYAPQATASAGAAARTADAGTAVAYAPAVTTTAGAASRTTADAQLVAYAPSVAVATSVSASAGSSALVAHAPSVSVAVGAVTRSVSDGSLVVRAPSASASTGNDRGVLPAPLIAYAPAVTTQGGVQYAAAGVVPVVAYAPDVVVSATIAISAGPAAAVAHAPDPRIAWYIDLFDSANVPAGGTATTNQLTAGTGTFLAGRLEDLDNPADSITPSGSQYTELEWAIKARTLGLDKTFKFRLTKAGTPVTNSLTPKLTISFDRSFAVGVSQLVAHAPDVTTSVGAVTRVVSDASLVAYAPAATASAGQVSRSVSDAQLVAHAPAVTLSTTTSVPAAAGLAVLHAPSATATAGPVTRTVGASPAVLSAPAVTTDAGNARTVGASPAVLHAPDVAPLYNQTRSAADALVVYAPQVTTSGGSTFGVTSGVLVAHAPAVTVLYNQTASAGSAATVAYAPAVTVSVGPVTRSASPGSLVAHATDATAAAGAVSRATVAGDLVAYAPAATASVGAVARSAGPAPLVAHAPGVTVTSTRSVLVDVAPTVLHAPDVTVLYNQTVSAGAGQLVAYVPSVLVIGGSDRVVGAQPVVVHAPDVAPRYNQQASVSDASAVLHAPDVTTSVGSVARAVSDASAILHAPAVAVVPDQEALPAPASVIVHAPSAVATTLGVRYAIDARVVVHAPDVSVLYNQIRSAEPGALTAHAPDVTTATGAVARSVGAAHLVASGTSVTTTQQQFASTADAHVVSSAPGVTAATGPASRSAGPAPAVVHAPAVTTTTGAVSRTVDIASIVVVAPTASGRLTFVQTKAAETAGPVIVHAPDIVQAVSIVQKYPPFTVVAQNTSTSLTCQSTSTTVTVQSTQTFVTAYPT